MIETERISRFQKIVVLCGLILAYFAFFKFPIADQNKVFGFYLFVFSFFLSLNMTVFVRWVAVKYNLLDHPDARKDHPYPIPLLGGVSIFISFILSIVIFEKYIPNTEKLYWILGMGFVILVVGIIDDVKLLSAKLRLLVQVIAAGVIISQGIRISFLPNNFAGDFFEVVLSILWIVGITNAINFIDGMDGLATGYIIITASLLGVVAYQLVMPEYLYILLALVGACAGFLPYNFRWHKRALIFLGDSGATFLGFFMGCLTLWGKWGSRNDVYHSTNEVGVVIPLLILGVVVFDTTFTYIMRFWGGKIKKFDHILTYAGRDHFHHCLYDIGLPEKAVVLIIYCITLYLGLGSIALRNARKIDAVILLFQAVLIFTMIGAFMAFVKRVYGFSNHNNGTGKEQNVKE